MSTQLTVQPKSVVQGETKTFLLTFTNKDLVTGSNPEGRVNLTGATVRFCVNKLPSSPSAIIDKTSDIPAEILILDQAVGSPTEGQARVFLVPTDTSSQAVGRFFYDAWAILPADERHATLLASPFDLLDGVCDIPAVAPPPSGAAASQGTDARSFQFTVPSTGAGPFPVTMGAMFDVGYCVSVLFNLPLPGGGAASQPLVGSKTVTGFDLSFLGPVAAGTILDIIVRDF